MAPRRQRMARLRNVHTSIAASSSNISPVFTNTSAVNQPASTNSPHPQTVIENPAHAIANGLKRKTAVGELGDARVMMTAEKRRRLTDENVEDTRRELDSGRTKRLELQLQHDLRIAQLADTRAERELNDRELEREFQLNMKEMDFYHKALALLASD